jgi:hypothetical protein
MESPTSLQQRRWHVLKILFSWPRHVLNVFSMFLASGGKHSHRSTSSTPTPQPKGAAEVVLSKLQDFSISTSFSGIDTPSTSLMNLGLGACEQMGLPASEMKLARNMHAIEWYSRSQDELLEHPHGPEHVFENINDFWHPAVKERLVTLVTMQLIQTVLVPLVLAGQSVCSFAYCMKCQKVCEASSLKIRYWFLCYLSGLPGSAIDLFTQ